MSASLRQPALQAQQTSQDEKQPAYGQHARPGKIMDACQDQLPQNAYDGDLHRQRHGYAVLPQVKDQGSVKLNEDEDKHHLREQHPNGGTPY